MATTGAPQRDEQRAQAPIRWPHPDSTTLALVGVWAVGLFVALFVPALFVAPTAQNPPTGRVWLAFSSTLVGSVVMLLAGTGLWRRSRDSSVLLLGIVPAVACIAGGVILTTAKLTGM